MRWPETPLHELVSLEYGAALRAADREISGKIPVAGSNGIDGYHTEALVPGPGIVVGRKGSAGKVTWFETDFWPIDTTYYVELNAEANLRWVYYLLNQLGLDRLKTLTGVPGLNRNDAYRLLVPLPPLSEQCRIVEILDQADALRKKRAEADAKAQRILPALFYKMFGDPATNPMGWERVALPDAVVGKYGIKAGPFGSSLKKDDYTTSGYRVYGQEQVIAGRFDIGNYYIGDRKYEQLKAYTVNEGDLLRVKCYFSHRFRLGAD